VIRRGAVLNDALQFALTGPVMIEQAKAAPAGEGLTCESGVRPVARLRACGCSKQSAPPLTDEGFGGQLQLATLDGLL
jgi:hypothetical protein